MANKDVNASVQAAERRQSAMERREAQLAALSSQQSDLKREAAERQAKRDHDNAAEPPTKAKPGRGRGSR